jgi:hypothetical protein
MRRTVKNDVRLFGFKDLIDPPGLANIGDAWPNVGSHPAFAKLAVDLKKIILRPLDQQNALRTKSHHLPTYFRADAATSPGHQDPLSRQKALKLRCIEINRGTPKQFGRCNLEPADWAHHWPNPLPAEHDFVGSRRDKAQ